MTAITAGAKGRKRARDREYRRRMRLDPEYRARERAYERTPKRASADHARKAARPKVRDLPYIGIDGEGLMRTDEKGRQDYVLLVAAGADGFLRTLQADGARLMTRDILEFLCNLPAKAALVGFYIGYDVTQWLRGLAARTMEQVLFPKEGRHGEAYTFWGDYAIKYRPRQFFRIARVRPDRKGIIPGSARTIRDIYGLFQQSFANAIEKWNVGTPETRELIGAGKDKRREFDRLTSELILYCTLECSHLAMLMERAREVLRENDAMPVEWGGIGSITAALFKKHGIPQRPEDRTCPRCFEPVEGGINICSCGRQLSPLQRPARPQAFEEAIRGAYFGGRFEVIRHGRVLGPIYDYDINSAYAAAARGLPCAMHTTWEHVKGERAERLALEILDGGKAGLFVARLEFFHDPHAHWCGFPVRKASGAIFYPCMASGWYWSEEIAAARKDAGAATKIREAWFARTECRCGDIHAPWIEDLYERRRKLGKAEGGLLKLALAAIGGKYSQGIGRAPYQDFVQAGIINARTRAWLLEAAGQNPEAVFIMATDGIASTAPLDLDIGDGLGQWKLDGQYDDFFVVAPGIYWPSGAKLKPKRRGIPLNAVQKYGADLERRFAGWFASPLRKVPPAMTIKFDVFIGHREARARKNPSLAGKWVKEDFTISFDWRSKRDREAYEVRDGHILTFPHLGSHSLVSKPYQRAEGEDDTKGRINERLYEGLDDHEQILPEE